MWVIFLSYLLANAHHTAVAVPPPPSVWFPTETTAEQRPPRIESKKESNDWAQFGSVQIPSIAVSDHPSTRRKTNDGESNNAVERATTKALHSHPEIFPVDTRVLWVHPPMKRASNAKQGKVVLLLNLVQTPMKFALIVLLVNSVEIRI